MTYWKAWRTASGRVAILRAISNRPAATAPARSGEEEVEDDGGGVGEQAAGGVGREQGEAGGEEEPEIGAGDGGADQKLQIVIAAEQRHAEQGGEGQRAQMGEDEADASGAEREEAQSEEDPGDLLPEEAKADLGPEGAAGPGGGGRDLDEGPQRQAPRRTSATAVGRLALSSAAAEKRRGDPVGVQGDQEGDQRGGEDGDEQGGLDRAVGGLVVLGRNDPLQGAGQRQVDEILERS